LIILDNNISFLTIVVLYKISVKGSASLFTLNKAAVIANRTIEVLVYDNSPKPDSDINNSLSCYSNIIINYVSDTSNKGLSYAYNYGANLAREKNYNWLLLLDQDTRVSSEYLNIIYKEVPQNPLIKLFCPKLYLKDGSLFSPCRYFFKRGFQLKEIKEGINSLKQLSPVNSGMLISTDAFFEAGGYNEKVKLDFSDFQFIERFKRKYDNFFVLKTSFLQDFSNDEVDPIILNNRFKNFCESAKNCETSFAVEKLQYFFVVLARAAMLTKRSGSLIFLNTFRKYYL
jgi:rhamnosyltransferase